MTFKVGDRVRYKSEATRNYTSFFNSYKAGLVGTIVRAQGDHSNGGSYLVLFDLCQMNKSGRVSPISGLECSCYGVNLELSEYKYDPSQQGDTEEDI